MAASDELKKTKIKRICSFLLTLMEFCYEAEQCIRLVYIYHIIQCWKIINDGCEHSKTFFWFWESMAYDSWMELLLKYSYLDTILRRRYFVIGGILVKIRCSRGNCLPNHYTLQGLSGAIFALYSIFLQSVLRIQIYGPRGILPLLFWRVLLIRIAAVYSSSL